MEKKFNSKRTNIFLLMLFSLLIFGQQVLAQERKLSGKVTGANGLPIPGAVVKIKGKSGGLSTNQDGAFVINAQTGDVLQVSSIGFISKEITVPATNVVNVTLTEDQQNLSEVVVVGYGVQQKKLITGATVQVKGDAIQKQSTTNALQGLQGQAPGVQIASTSGQPGEGMRVTIRGLGTIGNSGPLYVVDGVLTGDISYLNPADIESIDVLKDAASAAIYGSQAANGVILVTTNRENAGKRLRSHLMPMQAYKMWRKRQKCSILLNMHP